MNCSLLQLAIKIFSSHLPPSLSLRSSQGWQINVCICSILDPDDGCWLSYPKIRAQPEKQAKRQSKQNHHQPTFKILDHHARLPLKNRRLTATAEQAKASESVISPSCAIPVAAAANASWPQKDNPRCPSMHRARGISPSLANMADRWPHRYSLSSTGNGRVIDPASPRHLQ